MRLCVMPCRRLLVNPIRRSALTKPCPHQIFTVASVSWVQGSHVSQERIGPCPAHPLPSAPVRLPRKRILGRSRPANFSTSTERAGVNLRVALAAAEGSDPGAPRLTLFRRAPVLPFIAGRCSLTRVWSRPVSRPRFGGGQKGISEPSGAVRSAVSSLINRITTSCPASGSNSRRRLKPSPSWCAHAAPIRCQKLF